VDHLKKEQTSQVQLDEFEVQLEYKNKKFELKDLHVTDSEITLTTN